jgi:predicted nucleic acid-binding protein
MSVLLDTNILTRLAEPTHPQRATALKAVESLESAGRILHIVPQNLYEFWVVATRPATANGGLGLTVAEARAELESIRGSFVLLHDIPAVLSEWEKLVVAHDCKGKPAHDARLVAAMHVHGIAELLTFNGPDFGRYSGIAVLEPAAVAAAAGRTEPA